MRFLCLIGSHIDRVLDDDWRQGRAIWTCLECSREAPMKGRDLAEFIKVNPRRQHRQRP